MTPATEPTVAAAQRLRDPAWPRRLSGVIVAILILWPILEWTEFRPWTLWDKESLKQTGNFLESFFPPKLSVEFLVQVAHETWRTIAMATVGITLAIFLAVPFALIAVRVLSLSGLSGRMQRLPTALREVVRALLIILRSVPELIWALIFVRVVGLGPTSGVLAIALTYAGMLGKVYAEILESGDPSNSQALMRNGAGRLQTLFYALLPQNADELISYTIYRWECAIRSSAVLGFVGAGGLGQMMDASLKMFNGSEVFTLLIVFLLLVWCSDMVSAWLRKFLS
ncbi:MAG: phosphonate ABC transporter, permease protein PhnE [Alcaligenaceae bacterium]|nr:MAG: phosphonate ABC transporter, permease protein PhnE [Alcaligenaceae bacterium]